jgi:hypothetical protein
MMGAKNGVIQDKSTTLNDYQQNQKLEKPWDIIPIRP